MRFLLVSAALILSACSETPIEEQNETEMAETEKEIAAEAKSIEEAADEAVKVLEEEIEAELQDDGITSSEPAPAPTDNDEGE